MTKESSPQGGFRRKLARLNRNGLNRVTRRLFRYLPGFGVIEHRGRRTGKAFLTPVNLFPHQDRFVVALTYGADSDWVKNVLTAGECGLTTRGQTYRVYSPRIYRDERRRDVRPFERTVLKLLRVVDFLELRPASTS